MNGKIINKNSLAHALGERMTKGTTKTLRVGCILLLISFLICTFVLLPQPVQAVNTVTATVTGLNGPTGMAVTPDGAYVYVANSGGTTVSVISTATNTVTTTVTVGSTPTGVAITPNGAYAYVPNSGGTTVSVISTATNTVTANVTGLNAPSGVAVTPNGAYAYVTNIGIGSVSVISTATSTVTTASPSPTVPEFSSVVLVSAVVALIASVISVIALKARNEKTLRR